MSHFALLGLNTNWITKTAGLSSGLSISIFYQISLTSSNGMANSQRSPIFKPPGILEAVLLSARTVLPIKSSSALSLSITKESKSIAPKRSHKPSTPKFDPADEPPPYRRGEKASGDETPFSSPSSSKTGSDDSKTPRDFHPPPSARTRSKHMSPLREVADQRALHGFMCLSQFPI